MTPTLNIEIPQYRASHLTIERARLVQLMDQERTKSNVDEVIARLQIYKDKMEALQEDCQKKIEVAKESKRQGEVMKLQDWCFQHIDDASEFVVVVENFIKSSGNDAIAVSQEEVKPGESATSCIGSRMSKQSSNSSIRSSIARAKAKLTAEMKVQQEKRAIEDRKLQLRREEEDLQLKFQAIEIEALEEQITEEDRRSNRSVDNFFLDPPESIKELSQPSVAGGLNTEDKSSESSSKGRPGNHFYPCNPSVNSQQDAMATMAMAVKSQLSLPRNEPPIFDGDHTKFQSFIIAFESQIIASNPSAADKYYYLERYTSGEAQALVRSCCGMDLELAYDNAMSELKRQYGGQVRVAQAYLTKLGNWPKIAYEDGKALREFSLYLRQCKNLMASMSHLNQLNSTRELEIVVSKLPTDLRRSWRDHYCALLEKGEEVTFSQLQTFVAQKADVINSPCFGQILEERRPKKSEERPTNKKIFNTVTNNKAPSKTRTVVKSCVFCNGGHWASNCTEFIKLSPEKRCEYVRANHLCFNCLSKGHNSKDCKRKLRCQHCNKLHSTSMHYFKESRTSESQHASHQAETQAEESQSSSLLRAKEVGAGNSGSVATSMKTSKSCHTRVLCPAIPVRIRKHGSTEQEITYLGLDSYSNDCFINCQLLKTLNLSGQEETIQVTTMGAIKGTMTVKLVKNLEVTSLDGRYNFTIDQLHGKEKWPFDLEDSPKKSDIVNCNHLKYLPIEFLEGKTIDILVGMNQPELMWTLETIRGTSREPFATRHYLGWALNGLVASRDRAKSISVSHIKVEQLEELSTQIDHLYAQDFVDPDAGERAPSVEDKQWMDSVQSSFRQREDGFFEIALPFRDTINVRPNNFSQAYCRIMSLGKKLRGDPNYHSDYTEFMEDMIRRGYMERVPSEMDAKQTQVWFLSHHAVYHKQKKKIRVVVDCSLKFGGQSQNDCLLQGPDLANNLLGVLLRFREHRYAISGDIEKMFLQVKVPPRDADLQRVLWFPQGDFNKEPEQYRLTTHVFGAISSPSCANFALHQTAVVSHNRPYSPQAKQAVKRDFYVDDFMKSMENEDEAITLLHEVRDLVAEGGFNLTGFYSNSTYVLSSIPKEHLADRWKQLDVENDELPQERALGVSWMVEHDGFGFRVNFEDHPNTRRGILATVASIYDPLGLAAPIIVTAKLIFQRSCETGSWDDEIKGDLLQEWKQWVTEVRQLMDYMVPRCIGAGAMEVLKGTNSLHIFCDGSEKAYGAVAYTRWQQTDGTFSSNLVMAKTRLVPRNQVKKSTVRTIPRIELNAARLAVQMYLIMRKELTIPFQEVVFWSDSTTVLAYLSSSTARFQRFVAHRVEFIREHTKVEWWRHVPGEENIADILTKGYPINKFKGNKDWKTGPAFLTKESHLWPIQKGANTLNQNDPEIQKEVKSFSIETIQIVGANRLIHSTNSWLKLRMRVAVFHAFGNWILDKSKPITKLSPKDLSSAELAIFRFVQKEGFAKEIQELKINGISKAKVSGLHKLRPFISKEDDLLRVGGRLQHSALPEESKHPIILPKNSPLIANLIIDCHRREGHQGRLHVLTQLRKRYWILGGISTVRKVIGSCLVCRKQNARPNEQLMAPLPEDRVTGCQNPFSSVGIDYFGPIHVTEGRKSHKRYGVVFSCLASRAIHIEVADSLDANSFINAFRRFCSRRVTPRVVRSDNGTNLAAGCSILKEELKQLNQGKIEDAMLNEGIDWKFNPPTASHFGGVYEREIRSIRKVLNGIMEGSQARLNTDMLTTLMCEVEAILNNRPLVPLSDDPNDPEPLTPNHLLKLDSEIPFPPCVTDESNIYAKQRWKQVQYLVDMFWKRWTREYLPLLQSRQKWTCDRRSLKIGDLVLVVDQLLPRNQWCLGRVIREIPSKDHRVRRVLVRVSKCRRGDKTVHGATELERPVTKLVLLRASEEL